ncbi:MAG: WGxxGxxG family protein [Janthinobacterium lividum]
MKRRFFALLVASVLTGSALAQTGNSDTSGSGSNTTSRQTETEPHHEYGWIGLLGLIGLAGLRRQHHTDVVDTHRS